MFQDCPFPGKCSRGWLLGGAAADAALSSQQMLRHDCFFSLAMTSPTRHLRSGRPMLASRVAEVGHFKGRRGTLDTGHAPARWGGERPAGQGEDWVAAPGRAGETP